jgi:hypothetical protein
VKFQTPLPFAGERANETSFMGSLIQGMGKRNFIYGFLKTRNALTNFSSVFPVLRKSEIILGWFSLI